MTKYPEESVGSAFIRFSKLFGENYGIAVTPCYDAGGYLAGDIYVIITKNKATHRFRVVVEDLRLSDSKLISFYVIPTMNKLKAETEIETKEVKMTREQAENRVAGVVFEHRTFIRGLEALGLLKFEKEPLVIDITNQEKVIIQRNGVVVHKDT